MSANLSSSINPHDLQRIQDAATKLRQIKGELNQIVVERQDAIEVMLLAILLEQHVLMSGPPGTAKSFLAEVFTSAITGADIFKINLDKFSTPSEVFGAIDAKLLREEGTVRYRTEGGIVPADIAYLDEVLDANPPVLRTLLSVLNERVFRKGNQEEKSKLIMAIGTTNGNPQDAITRNPELEAFLDRFRFKVLINPIKDEANQQTIIERKLNGHQATTTTKIDLSEIKFLGQVIRDYNLVPNGAIAATYITLINKLEKQGFTITDRTMIEGLQIIEAVALLEGRITTTYDDLFAVHWFVCLSGDEKQLKQFYTIATPIIDQAKLQERNKVDDLANKIYDGFDLELARIEVDYPNLMDRARRLHQIYVDTEHTTPEQANSLGRRKKMLQRIHSMEEAVHDEIFGISQPQATSSRRRSQP